MARKKNSDVITGIPKDPEKDLTVQKSRPLFALWQSDLALSDFKILDMYLSRIDSHDPSHRTVVLGKGELEKALGITQIKKNDLHARLKRLYSPIDLTPNDENSLDLVSLFERAKAEKDEYGLWQIRLTCTESAMKYVFNVDKLGYFRYKLRTVTSITSRYTYILFNYLEVNRDFKTEWTVDLNELKRILHCEDDETYKQYKRFNDLILKKCHKDLNEKTECRFSYESIKKGRTVVAVKFKLEPLPKESQQLPGQQQLPLDPADDPNSADYAPLFDDEPPKPDYFAEAEFIANALPPELTLAQVKNLMTLAAPNVPDGPLPWDNRLFDYLHQKTLLMKAQKNPVRDKVAWLKGAVAGNWK